MSPTSARVARRARAPRALASHPFAARRRRKAPVLARLLARFLVAALATGFLGAFAPAQVLTALPDGDLALRRLRVLLDEGRAADARDLARAELERERDPRRALRLSSALVESLRLGDDAFDPHTLELACRTADDACAWAGPCSDEELDASFQLALLLSMRGESGDTRVILEHLRDELLARGGMFQRELARVLIELVDASDGDDSERALLLTETIQRSTCGPDDPDVAWRLSREGTLAFNAEPERARAAFERALAIRVASQRADHPSIGTDLHNLGSALVQLGDLAGAKDVLEQALATRTAAFGPRHRHVGFTLSALAHLELTLGDVAAAREHAERACAVLEERLAPGSARVVAAFQLLADACLRLLDDAGALRACERGFASLDRAADSANPAGAANTAADRAHLHRLRGYARQSAGDVAAARADFEAARELHERSDRRGTEYAVLLVDLGVLELEPSRAAAPETAAVPGNSRAANAARDGGASDRGLARGIALLRRGCALLELTSGAEAPLLAHGLAELAAGLALEGSQASRTEALELALRSQEILARAQRRSAAGLEQRASATYVQNRAHGLATAIELAAQRGSPAEIARVWSALVATRGLVFDELARRFRSLRTSDAPGLAGVRTALAHVREELSRVACAPASAERSDADAERVRAAAIAAIAARRDALERELLARAPPSSDADGAARATCCDVSALANALGRRALVAYVRYERGDGSGAYAAFALRAGDPAPRLALLGPASTLEPLVLGVHDAARAPGSERDWRAAALELRRALWDPLATILGPLATDDEVVVVPDAAVCLVPFAALPADATGASGTTGAARYLADDGPLFHFVGAERDLVERSSGAASASSGLLALGGADFGTPGAGTRARFAALPHASEEAERVAAIWSSRHPGERVELLTGAAAIQSEFTRSAAGKRVLHLATHGFSAGAPSAAAPEIAVESASAPRTRGGSLVRASSPVNGTHPGSAAPGSSAPVGGAAAVASDVLSTNGRFVLGGSLVAATSSPTGLLRSLSGDPLLSAGLCFAGANLHVDATGGDGILTAEEALDLDLAGVDLVVLSACDSGLGEVLPLEGLFGMPRALRLAGARTVVQSLWPVLDEATLTWMDAFYGEKPEEPARAAFAVRAAMRQRLKDLRARGADTHPYEWGAFVAIGSPAP